MDRDDVWKNRAARLAAFRQEQHVNVKADAYFFALYRIMKRDGLPLSAIQSTLMSADDHESEMDPDALQTAVTLMRQFLAIEN